MAHYFVTPEQIALADKNLPAAARIYSRLQTVLASPDSDVSDVVALVKVDTALSANVVRSSNCVFYKRGAEVTTIDEAIKRIGLREVNRLVGLTMSARLFANEIPLFGLNSDALWKNSVATALSMARLCRVAEQNDRVGYTLGLLRPVGRLVLARIAPDERLAPAMPGANVASSTRKWERGTFGKTSAEVSSILLSQWGFPFDHCEAMRSHDHLAEAIEPTRLGSLLHLAGWVTSLIGFGLSCEKDGWTPSRRVLADAGLSIEIVEAAVDETRNELAQLRDVLHLAVAA